MPPVTFIDTSILCNLVPVAGRDNDRNSVTEEFLQRVDAAETLILPFSALVETGNHISKIPGGHERRTSAQRFEAILQATADGRAPWSPHLFEFGPRFITTMLDGAGTHSSYLEHAMNKFACGDLCILCERSMYMDRSLRTDVGIWTLDDELAAHS